MDINSCKYSEELVESLRLASEAILTPLAGNNNVDIALLNTNTAIINAEIKIYRATRNSLSPNTASTTPLRTQEFRSFAIEFPSIERRINLSDITSAEVTQIISSNSLNPTTLGSQTQQNPRGVLLLVENYLLRLGNGLDVVGSCFVVNNVYSNVSGRKDVFNNAGSFGDEFTSFVNTIGAKLEEVLALVKKLLSLVGAARSLLANIQQTAQTAVAALSGSFDSDFGFVEAAQLASVINNLLSYIQSIKDVGKETSCPISKVSIESMTSQLTQLSILTSQLNVKMYEDYANASNIFDELAGGLYAEAESVSVSNPSRTQEISNSIKQAMEGTLSSTFATLGEASKGFGITLETDLNAMREIVRGFAAVGVLRNLDREMSSVIDGASSQLKSKIFFFATDILSNNFNFNMGPIQRKNAGLVASAQKAASDETANQMKDVVRGQIAIAIAKYRDPQIEEVDFVVLRFGNLVREIERLFDLSIKPLESVHTQFRDTNVVLSAAGNGTTLTAIGSGATRFDTQARLEASRLSGSLPATTARGGVANLPQGTVPYVGYGPTPNIPTGYTFPSYQDAVAGKGGIKYSPGPSSSLSGPAGFTPMSIGGGVDVESMYMLYLLATRWGQTIVINSAYRSPRANRSAGGKPGSLHLAGKAFDCSVSGRSNQIRFMNLAYQVGFRGFGSYGTFVHVDTRGSRGDWGNFQYYSLSGTAGTKGG